MALAEEIRAAGEANGTPIVINGVIGPRGDGYDPGEAMSADEAQRYHARQVATFADTAADMVTAVTMTTPEEAIGIARAAREHELPAVDLVHGGDRRAPAATASRWATAIERVDAQTGGSVAYFMINCAHPTHFAGVLEAGGAWRERIGGVRANASRQEPRRARRGRGARRGRPRSRSAPRTVRCARAWARWRCSAAAAAPTTAT